MKRERFKRSTIASSRGNYVRKAHRQYLREEHEKFIEMSISIKMPTAYFVKCFGKLMQITEREAMMLKRHINIITK